MNMELFTMRLVFFFNLSSISLTYCGSPNFRMAAPYPICLLVLGICCVEAFQCGWSWTYFQSPLQKPSNPPPLSTPSTPLFGREASVTSVSPEHVAVTAGWRVCGQRLAADLCLWLGSLTSRLSDPLHLNHNSLRSLSAGDRHQKKGRLVSVALTPGQAEWKRCWLLNENNTSFLTQTLPC